MSEQPWNDFLSKTINIFGQFGAHFYISLKTWMVSILVTQESNKRVCVNVVTELAWYQSCGTGVGADGDGAS